MHVTGPDSNLPRPIRYVVRYAEALGSGWHPDNFESAPTLEAARTIAKWRRAAGFHVQIETETGLVVT